MKMSFSQLFDFVSDLNTLVRINKIENEIYSIDINKFDFYRN